MDPNRHITQPTPHPPRRPSNPPSPRPQLDPSAKKEKNDNHNINNYYFNKF